MNVYLDESGDLGWTLNKDYGKGGSSRFLTIAFIVCPSEKTTMLKRIVRDIYNKAKADPKTELKGAGMPQEIKLLFARNLQKLLSVNTDIHLGAITVNKNKVKQHIREDSNMLYYFMIRTSVLPCVQSESLVNLIRDNKSVKVKSGNSLIDYLQTELWFELHSKAKIVDLPSDSKMVKCLQLIDWVSNIVFGKYELGNEEPYNIIEPVLHKTKLYF